MRRILAAAVLSAVAVVSSGCGSQGGTQPVSAKVQDYYDKNIVNRKGPVLPSAPPVKPLTVASLASIQARVADAKPLTISVLGDSTGNDAEEWVDLWAQHLAEADATVTVRSWKESSDAWPPTTHGDGARKVTIWNGSQPGASSAYARLQFKNIQPAKPDLIIYNYGHNPSTSGTVEDVETLQRMAETRWGKVPFVVTIQNVARGAYAADTAKANAGLKAWAKPLGVPLIDVSTVITAQNLDTMLIDEVHPNKDASRLWADAVIETLG